MYIDSEEQLRKLYAFPDNKTEDKPLDSLEKHAINFIEHCPFIMLSTYDKFGLLDSSPRGGQPGFVKIINENCIVIPDSRSGKRLDSLVNIIETGNIACLFLIPGVGEILRLSGTARVSTKKEHLDSLRDESGVPVSCIEVTIKEMFLYCAAAAKRSNLWLEESKIERPNLPTKPQILNDQPSILDDAEKHAEMVSRYQKTSK